jgi:NADPH-dependent glutamate synthase beta subunit-like oxidoreductase
MDHRPGPPTGKRVLVVGAGPAGLSCAYHLRRFGHDVEIRDANSEPGGMMHYGIPPTACRARARQGDRAHRSDGGDDRPQLARERRARREGGGRSSTRCSSDRRPGRESLDIPAMDGGKIIDAVTLMEQVEKGRAPSLGRVVGIVGGGNTAMDARASRKRLGAEEAVIIFRFDKAQMEAHPYEAMEAFAEGVKIKWLSTVKQFGEDEIVVEQMEMLPDGSAASARDSSRRSRPIRWCWRSASTPTSSS